MSENTNSNRREFLRTAGQILPGTAVLAGSRLAAAGAAQQANAVVRVDSGRLRMAEARRQGKCFSAGRSLRSTNSAMPGRS